MIRPKIAPGGDTDANGTRWVNAMVTSEGEVIAGYPEDGRFQMFVQPEELFLFASGMIQALREKT